MHITPDAVVFAEYGPWKLNATIVFTWVVMAFLAVSSWLITRHIGKGRPASRYQTLLDIIVSSVSGQMRECGLFQAEKYLPFVGTLFLFIFFGGIFAVIPGYEPPCASLSTTAALALAVFVAVPYYAIREKGVLGYLKHYLHPAPILLPFNLLEDLTRTLALAMRLFGNTMSEALMAAIVVGLVPLFFPLFLSALDLITTSVQSYIFSILATVYIAAATRKPGGDPQQTEH